MSGAYGAGAGRSGAHVIDELVALLPGVRGGLGSPGQPDVGADLDAAARVALGTLAEPGDGMLGELVELLGAPRAAELLFGGASIAAIAAAVAGAGGLPSRELEKGVGRWRPRIDRATAVQALEQAARVGARLLRPGDRHWPSGFADLGRNAPLALWVRGDTALLGGAASGAGFALVGARAASSYGQQVALEAAAGLVRRGFTIVSGGAYGIDGTAHRSALGNGGDTIAFLAGGVDRFYPVGHEQLLSEIAARGAVASELPCGQSPTRWRFLQRNRLIAAAGAAIVIVEAGRRSGSLNTANHALTLGRPLGAVPGPVTSPSSVGCHRLIRDNHAVCVTDAGEMAELAGGLPPEPEPTLWSDTSHDDNARPAERPSAPLERDPALVRILDAMSTRVVRGIPELARRSGLEPAQTMGALGTLEALGRARRIAEGWLAVRAT